MYNVLAVDDDTTCLLILKACLKKWNYQGKIFKSYFFISQSYMKFSVVRFKVESPRLLI